LRATATGVEQPPLIVIPGAFGTRLVDSATGRELWPTSNRALLFGAYPQLELRIDPETLEPDPGTVVIDGIFADGLGRDFYGKVLRTLEGPGGFRRHEPGDPVGVGQRHYYLYLYDWRLDNATAARGLHLLLQRIRADYGNPQLKVDVLAHSNGGLLARYYARYGTATPATSGPTIPIQPGRDGIRRLLMVGTPNLGTVQPVLSHLRGEEIGLGKIRPEVIATCPGATQLLPHPCTPWLIDLAGNPVPRDVFDAATWRDLRWSIFAPRARRRIINRHGGGSTGARYLEILEHYFARQLQQGHQFVEALAAPGDQLAGETYLFGGDCEPTLARLVLEKVDDRMYARERPGDIAGGKAGIDYSALMFEPGDPVVTRNSLEGRYTALHHTRHGATVECRMDIALLPVQHGVFFCEEHQGLTGNVTFRDNLLYALLRHANHPAAASGR